MQSLDNFIRTILITRPKAQAHKLCHLIKKIGLHPIQFPTIEIILSKNLQQQINALHFAQYELAIFTSANAAISLVPYKNLIFYLAKKIPVAAIGLATKQALENMHIPVQIIPSNRYNSENLLQTPELHDVAGKNIVVFKGEGGRDLLQQTLIKRGAVITEVICYQRIKPTTNTLTLKRKLKNNEIHIILCTSNETLSNLFSMLDQESQNLLKNIQIIAISDRIKAQAQELGFLKEPIIADNATDAAILSALKNYTKTDGR